MKIPAVKTIKAGPFEICIALTPGGARWANIGKGRYKDGPGAFCRYVDGSLNIPGRLGVYVSLAENIFLPKNLSN